MKGYKGTDRNLQFENTRRDAEYYDHHIPKIAKSLERIANALEKVKQADQFRSMTDEFIDREMRDLMRRTIRCEESTQIGWISVKDRMPEMNRHVIGFCASKEPELSDGVIEIVYLKDTINFLAEHKVMPYWCCDVREFFRTNYEVTHWMPLPEPPKEVQDDESL